MSDQNDPAAYVVPHTSEKDIAEMELQWKWIEEHITKSTADHLFVAGHYSVYSACVHGNTRKLIKNLKPLLEKYNAHYISGHDHC